VIVRFFYIFIFLHITPFCIAHPLINAARDQIGKTLTYDGRYQKLPYPMGDVPLSEGVCCDVVIRALRQAYGIDLQQAIHEDMRKRWEKYPKIWGLKKPDTHIDHRRVPNIVTFFRHHDMAVVSPTAFNPGDIATWKVFGLPHIGIVSDRSIQGRPLVLHNISRGTQEEDFMGQYTPKDVSLTGVFRLTPEFIKRFQTQKAIDLFGNYGHTNSMV
jgi:uncharacterized protein YijF (DUF1287 family)